MGMSTVLAVLNIKNKNRWCKFASSMVWPCSRMATNLPIPGHILNLKLCCPNRCINKYVVEWRFCSNPTFKKGLRNIFLPSLPLLLVETLLAHNRFSRHRRRSGPCQQDYVFVLVNKQWKYRIRGAVIWKPPRKVVLVRVKREKKSTPQLFLKYMTHRWPGSISLQSFTDIGEHGLQLLCAWLIKCRKLSHSTREGRKEK